jgi:nucleoside-diphosphate-sugar epimerase
MHKAGGSIVLTGATGFLGAFLMEGLLERGYQVTVLGRASKDLSLSDRLFNIVRWLGVTDPLDRLCSVEADFSRAHLGLDNAAYSRLCASTCKIIHCASDTSFAERDRMKVMATNVENLPALLEFAYDADVQCLYYVSTAYACGKCRGICMETPIVATEFTNVYEESKAQAESIILQYCESKGVPVSILRPSIVYGHSKTGRALKFNALYYAVKSLLAVRDIYLRDIAEQGGTKSGKWGISLGGDGILNLPLSVCIQDGGYVNLIPVDYFVESALRIIEQSGAGGIYHITNDDPPVITTLVEYAQRFLGVNGVRIEYTESKLEPNPAEELLDRFIKPYRPYLSDARVFDRNRTKSVSSKLAAPPLTYDIFERCMAYAIECCWGKKNGFPV